jgi:hypothetical protein
MSLATFPSQISTFLSIFLYKRSIDSDYCFISPPWDRRDGEPYLVARIIEFISYDLPSPDSNPTRVRVAYFLRSRDVSTRYTNNPRLLYATMHSDVCPTAYIRGKCRVKHRDHIPDLEGWKSQPDSFYFHQVSLNLFPSRTMM